MTSIKDVVGWKAVKMLRTIHDLWLCQKLNKFRIENGGEGLKGTKA